MAVANFTAEQLDAIAAGYRGDAHSFRTKQQYQRYVNEFIAFVHDKYADDAILPLKVRHIEGWLAFIAATRNVQWGSFQQRIAALRKYSRTTGYWDVSHLDYNPCTTKSTFCEFMKGLRKKIPTLPTKKAGVVSGTFLGLVVHEVMQTESNLYLLQRDVLVLTLCFLFGLRANDLCQVNLEHVTFEESASNEELAKLIIVGGKTTAQAGEVYVINNDACEFDLVRMLRDFWTETQRKYDDLIIFPDEKGLKLFHNIIQRTKVITKRMNAYTVGSILKGRIKEYYVATKLHISQEELEDLVAPYSSHSLKRSALTEAAKKGASDEQLKSMFRMKTTKATQQYVCGVELEKSSAQKKPTLLLPDEIETNNLKIKLRRVVNHQNKIQYKRVMTTDDNLSDEFEDEFTQHEETNPFEYINSSWENEPVSKLIRPKNRK